MTASDRLEVSPGVASQFEFVGSKKLLGIDAFVLVVVRPLAAAIREVPVCCAKHDELHIFMRVI